MAWAAATASAPARCCAWFREPRWRRGAASSARCLAVWPRGRHTSALIRERETPMGFLSGKRALIVGVASQRSIATGIAEAMHREGAELAFTYQTEKLRSRVEDCAAEYGGSKIILPCDVADDDQIDAVFAELGKHCG